MKLEHYFSITDYVKNNSLGRWEGLKRNDKRCSLNYKTSGNLRNQIV